MPFDAAAHHHGLYYVIVLHATPPGHQLHHQSLAGAVTKAISARELIAETVSRHIMADTTILGLST